MAPKFSRSVAPTFQPTPPEILLHSVKATVSSSELPANSENGKQAPPEIRRWLHLTGIWYFWAAIWVSYAPMALSGDAKTMDVVYTVLGLLALMLRIAAFLKARAGQPERS